jgi:hypothetical protein
MKATTVDYLASNLATRAGGALFWLLGAMTNSSSLSQGKLQSLLILSEAFVGGNGRNGNFVGELEGLFRHCFDSEFSEEFEELEYAFAMYGAESSEADNKMLEISLANAIPKLEKLIDGCIT